MSITDDLLSETNTIRLEMIDISTGETMGVSEMPPEQLPETFEIETTLHIGEFNWSIVEAIPAKAEDFLKTKSLVLKLRKVAQANPKDILFSLPTICNVLPEVSDTKLFEDGLFTLREDDWRQYEFLNPTDKPLVDSEVEKILFVCKNHSKELDTKVTAFDKIHVRTAINDPNLKIDFEKLKGLLTVTETGNIKFNNEDGFIENGFYLKTADSIFYGILENNLVTHFCLGAASEKTIEKLPFLEKELNLIFVNWISL